MAKRKVRETRKHRLLITHRQGQHWRVTPLLIALMGAVLYGAGWLYGRGLLLGGDRSLLEMIRARHTLILILIGASLLLYVLSVWISRASHVEARRKALRVRAGLVPVNLSYGRIRQIRLVQLSSIYPPQKLKRRHRRLLKPFAEVTCTAVDILSWPRLPLRLMWNRFMFTPDGQSLLLVVEKPMLLNQQIDGAMTERHARLTRGKRGYQDPIDRAMAQQPKSKR